MLNCWNLNTEKETPKVVQTLKSPPLREGPNKSHSQSSCVTVHQDLTKGDSKGPCYTMVQEIFVPLIMQMVQCMMWSVLPLQPKTLWKLCDGIWTNLRGHWLAYTELQGDFTSCNSYLLTLIPGWGAPVAGGQFIQVLATIYWKGSWAIINWKCPPFTMTKYIKTCTKP